jgi:hypothetical protein
MEGRWWLLIFAFFFHYWFGVGVEQNFGVRACQKS